MRSSSPSHLALLVLASVLTACPRTPAPQPEEPAALDTEDPAEIVAEVARRERGTETMTALFRVTARRAGAEAESSRGALAVRLPDRLRLQIFSFGVMTVYDYIANGERYRVQLPLEGRSETGRFDDPVAERSALLRYDLRPLFLGRRDLADGEIADPKDGSETLIVRVGDRREWRRVEIARSTGAILAEEWGQGGAVVLRARYHDHRDVGGVPLPYRIVVAPVAQVEGATVAELEIEVSEYTRNRPVKDAVFEIAGDRAAGDPGDRP